MSERYSTLISKEIRSPYLPVCRHEGVVGTVEVIGKSVVKGEPCPEDGGKDDPVLIQVIMRHSKWCLHGRLFVLKSLADLVRHDFTDALDISLEAESVVLDIYIPELSHVPAE